MIKSRKRMEAQAKAKKEQEERQKKRDEELRSLPIQIFIPNRYITGYARQCQFLGEVSCIPRSRFGGILFKKFDICSIRLENERRTKELREREKEERKAREERQVLEAHLGQCQMDKTLAALNNCRTHLTRVAAEKWSSKQVIQISISFSEYFGLERETIFSSTGA